MSEHSPGPWRFDDRCYSIYRGDGWPCVASFSDADLPTPADGRLMAAAPDMLRLLRLLARIPLEDANLGIGPQTWIRATRKLLKELDGDQ